MPRRIRKKIISNEIPVMLPLAVGRAMMSRTLSVKILMMIGSSLMKHSHYLLKVMTAQVPWK
jgi:hypothetical protein